MTIPSDLQIRKPLLQYLDKTKQYHSLYDCVSFLEEKFQLTEEERERRYGGTHKRKIFLNKVTNAVSQFRIAQLIEDETKPGDASFKISNIGSKLIERNDDEITNKILKEFGEYSLIDEKNSGDVKNNEESTEESFDELSKKHAKQVQLDLLQQIKSRCSPTGFEKLCLELFEKMGYGETKHTGKPGDRGVDGIISEDKLGLRLIYVQTKKYEKPISSDEIYKFSGKCSRDKVSGIFVTTSTFSKDSIDEMKKEPLIKLIDGYELAMHLYEYNVGISSYEKIELKQIDIKELESFN
jgi:restriction system protein